MDALGFHDRAVLAAKHGAVNQASSLPAPPLAGPAVVIVAHQSAAVIREVGPEVANWEEL
jgi:hypothetical protein